MSPSVCPHPQGPRGKSQTRQRALAQRGTEGRGAAGSAGAGTLQWQVLGRDGLQRGSAGQPAARYCSLGHNLQETGVPEPPLTPEIPRPCSYPPGPLHPTLEHISCRALAMPLAGTLQWKT